MGKTVRRMKFPFQVDPQCSVEAFPEVWRDLVHPDCLFEESWWLGLPWWHLWRIPLGLSTGGLFKVNQIIGGETSRLTYLALSPSYSFQGTGTWPCHLSGGWELSWYSSVDQELKTQVAPRLLWVDTSLLCCEETFSFPPENNKKTLSPIQAVLALELKALRPLPAPGSFLFAAVGRAVNLSMQLIYVIKIKTSCTNVIKWNSSSMFLPSGITFSYFVVSLTFQNLTENVFSPFFFPLLW